MNPFSPPDSLLIDGIPVTLPVLNGDKESLSPKATFQKPCWVPDGEAHSCLNCGLKFSQLRRKHHCRNCGKIFCSKCCSGKMCLPHFDINEPEKVCLNCLLIVELMTKSKSEDMSLKYEAVTGLCNLTKTTSGLCKVIESGGIHIMLSMTVNGDLNLKCAIASALHSITQSMMLNSFLVEAGCLKALKNLLETSHDCNELLNDSLSALNLLCMDPNIRIKVLKEGFVPSLFTVVRCTGTSAVFAARILQFLVCNFDHHDFILQNHKHIISDLFDGFQNEDYQMQTCLSKMLMHFSAGSDTFRQLILQEDISRGFPLLYLLKGSSPNVLINAVCIIANFSLQMNQEFSHKYITALCELLTFLTDDSSDVLAHVGRGLANFAECSSNSLHLVHNLQTIALKLLKSTSEAPRIHGCRLINYLFSSEPTFTLDILSQSGMDEFIETIFDLPGITDVLNNLLLRKVSRLSISQKL
ncbi:uncharacterized protein LOC129216969 [Uloborus diversus]|uniref:uncharacterized protein LOC129216969 n=1 Tax=Uloborus diversus TaxID=327109 RepID=UPI002409AEC2|nr:uncharacterized protein LOC129216969 [Uloborus diversus]